MASATTIKRIDSLIWVLIFGGLIALVFGMAVDAAAQELSWLMMAGGIGLALAGAVLLYVRSRLREDS